MSTSSFSMNDMFSMLNIDSPKYAARGLSSDRHQRPVSEILKRESFKSPETQVLDQWFEDLQQYESSLEAMASASLDPKYKEEVQHVDQWFRYLNGAERTATIYTLLEHSTQVQIRFFIVVLQQMSQKDPLSALLLHHPEKEPASATATMMAKAELEASQKLASVIPYQTGRPMSRPIDRHTDFLSPPRYPTVQQQGMFETSRPKSVIEGDLSSIFKNDWSSFALVPPAVTRPKSADISNWSFHKGESPWTPKLDQPQWTSSNRSSVILGEQSPPVVLSVYGDDKSVFPDYNNSTFHAPTHHYNGGQFLNPPTNDGYFSDHSDQSNKSHGSRNKFKSKDKKNLDLVDMQLLEDVPAWLRSLRLHKYNPIFETVKWQNMLRMDDAALLAKGVAALGARRKLLKVFEQIKAHCQANNITY